MQDYERLPPFLGVSLLGGVPKQRGMTSQFLSYKDNFPKIHTESC